MVKLSLTSPAVATAASTLDELKQALGRLNSYTCEIGTARDAATSTVEAANRVVGLLGQLSELQRAQFTELQQANTSNLASQKQDLATLAETWSGEWRSEAAKSLSSLAGAAVSVGKAAEVPRQTAKLLDSVIVKLVEKQHLHQQEISAQHQTALHTQQTILEKQLVDWLAELTLEQSALRTRMRSASDEFVVTTKSHSTTLAGLIEHQQQLADDLAFLGEAMRPAAKFGAMLERMQQEINTMRTANAAASESMESHIEKTMAIVARQSQQLHANMQTLAADLSGVGQTLSQLDTRLSSQHATLMRQLTDQVARQQMVQEAFHVKTLAARASARIWQGVTLVAAIGAIAAGLLPRWLPL